MTTPTGSSAASGCQKPDPVDPTAVCNAAVATTNLCLAHLRPNERAAYLSTLTPGADIDVHDVTFSRAPDLLTELLAALDDSNGNAHFRDANFRGANFLATAKFVGTRFSGKLDFRDATFEKDTDFHDVTFPDEVEFNHASFSGDADFHGVTFRGKAAFRGTSFDGTADFHNATFEGTVDFTCAAFGDFTNFSDTRFAGLANLGTAQFAGPAEFTNAAFAREALFGPSVFADDASFLDATFGGNAHFSGATFDGKADFSLANFAEDAYFSETIFNGATDFYRAKFAGAFRLDGKVSSITAHAIQATSQVRLRLEGGTLDLSDAAFTGPVTVHGLRPPVRLLSLTGVDAERIVLTDVDLSECRFVGMHRIDQIRLDGYCVFAFDPSETRIALAEEHHWRAQQRKAAGKSTGGWQPAPVDVEVIEPARLEVVYRQLRKALEDAKNEPGASDFYYGEMEMRRARVNRRLTESWLLWLYWASSGYALRGRRALACLGVTIAVAITALTLVGFPTTGNDLKASGTLRVNNSPEPLIITVHQTEPLKALSARAEAACETTLNAVIFRAAETQLTTAGRYIDIGTRLLGPLLLGLSVITVRNQVKR